MGKTEVQAKIIGEKGTREYTFLVETHTNFIALPLEEIQKLGLRECGGKVKLMSATGLVEVNTYFVNVELLGQGVAAILVQAPRPVIGYGLLENRGFRINPVSGEVEPFPDDVVHPPYLL